MSTENSNTKQPCIIDSVNNCFFYFVAKGRYSISDKQFCGSSERTIDMRLFDIANNEALLNLLNLYYMQGEYGVTYTHETRAEWFCGYLVAFIHDSDRHNIFLAKSLTNPIVRLLITNNDLFERVKNVVNVSPFILSQN